MLLVFWPRQRLTSSLAHLTSLFVDAVFSVLVEAVLGWLLVTAHGVTIGRGTRGVSQGGAGRPGRALHRVLVTTTAYIKIS